MTWKIKFNPHAQKELAALDKSTQKKIIRFLEKRVLAIDDPRLLGASLRGELKGLWKYRVGDYRLICRIYDTVLELLVLRVGHRKNVYKKGLYP